MLILTRRQNERIYLGLPNGETISIVVLEPDRRGVRLGIDAPANVSIRRDDMIKQEPTPTRCGS